ncbi:hypothetical protein HZY62_15440 [Maribacter polysiphoniae]|uniref:KAP-like P-loop domain-containing protein n=1 Tax=Maribacter polysiphoniae TaxID=429344 RepID=A0A316DUD1_9FLAO|nr:P-loop NTPase fold protein [Maribacter polysiphoniae]MBD1261995.1 hypothetical protein [Maribacter polysiphoniae]PWK21681.1 KAP-like P-loop domain-containing protein [Maribacter polysiphoniae]
MSFSSHITNSINQVLNFIWNSIILKTGRTVSEWPILKPTVLFSSLLLFHVFFDKIKVLIENNLFISSSFSNIWLDITVIAATVFVILFFGIRFWYTRYKPSFSSFFLVFLLSYTSSFIFWNSDLLGWQFYKECIFQLPYVFYYLVPGSLFILYALITGIISLFPREKLYRSQFSNDEPIGKRDDDKLDYEVYVDNLSKILLHESFPKAFSVGLVGPWGNGKSSVLDLVKNELESNEGDRRKNIFIHFLPYLNHNEDDIINEFFLLLSSQLSKFDGKISNQILKYSQKLTDLYQSKNLVDFVSKPPNNIYNQAAKELYEDIDKSLTRINKKIIVFIDDLDRLSGEEIIQVLKLIRNTANFNNTIFVVAMDKDYVLQRLKSSNQILNSAYLEKFFQLEIYLPEIDGNVLRESFLKSFDNYSNQGISNFNDDIKTALLDRDILFDDYVKNLRDVKRYSNQIKFDYPFIKNEIDMVDFINFTFLKTRFPSIVNQLYKDKSNLLRYDDAKDIYHIEDLPEDQQADEGVSIPFDLDGIFDNFLSTSRTIDTKDLKEFKKYKIFNNIIKDQRSFENSHKIDCDDLYLLLKTLYTLFGKKDVKSSGSIQLSDNLNILFYRKIQTHNFTKNDFKELLDFENQEKLKAIVFNLDSDKKLPQFLKKLKWFKPVDINQLKKIIQVLLHLYQVKNDYQLNRIEIEKRLAIYVQELLTEKYGNPEENSSWLWEKIFEGKYLTLKNKIYLLGDLWQAKNENLLWGFSEQKVSDKAIELFKDQFDNIEDTPWEVSNFHYYSFYHSLKKIRNIQSKLNDLFKDFWNKRDIELLCAQTIDLPAFSYSVYQLSDIIIEIFGSKNKYVEFIKSHPDATKKEIKEYIEFLILLQKTEFKIAIDFKFKESKLIKKRIKLLIEAYKKNTSYDEIGNIKQVIFETNDMDFFYKIRAQQEFVTKHHIQVYPHSDYVVARINIMSNNAKSDLLSIAQYINKIGADYTGWKHNSLDKTKLDENESFLTHTNDPQKYIKIIHPKPLKF